MDDDIIVNDDGRLIDKSTGEIISEESATIDNAGTQNTQNTQKKKDKKPMNKTFATRLDAETFQRVSDLADSLGITDKRELLRHFIDLATTYQYRSELSQKASIIDGLDAKLSGIRRQVNELLAQNKETEDNVRGMFEDEIQALNNDNNELTEALINKDTKISELKNEIKELKAGIVDIENKLKDTEKRYAKLEEDHSIAIELNTSNKQKIADYEAKLKGFDELKIKAEELKDVNVRLEKEMANKDVEIANYKLKMQSEKEKHALELEGATNKIKAKMQEELIKCINQNKKPKGKNANTNDK